MSCTVNYCTVLDSNALYCCVLYYWWRAAEPRYAVLARVSLALAWRVGASECASLEQFLEDERDYATVEAAGRAVRERAQSLLDGYATTVEEDEQALEALRECKWERSAPAEAETDPSWLREEMPGEKGRQLQVLTAFRKGKKAILRELTRCCEWSCT